MNTREDTRTLRDLCQEVIHAQGACNLSGVLLAASRSMARLRELFPQQGTSFYNTNPIVRLWASKIHSLTGMGMSDTFFYGINYDWLMDYLDQPDTCKYCKHRLPIEVFTALSNHRDLGFYCTLNTLADLTEVKVGSDHYYGVTRNGLFYGIELDGHIHT